MSSTLWETEDEFPGLGLYVRDTNGEPHILAATARNGWFCMTCPVEGKSTAREMMDHIQEHLKPHQI